MAIRLADALIYLGARRDDSFDRELDRGERDTRSWAGRIGGAVRGFATTAIVGGAAAAAGAVLGIGAAAFQAAQTLDEAFDGIRIATGATGDELAALEEDFRTVFRSIPTAAGPAADVIGVLHQRLGLTGDSLRDLAIPLLEVSRLLGGDARMNAELYTRVMGDWGISTDEAAETLDQLFVIGQRTGIGLDRLMEQVVQFGSPLRLMGFRLEESAALFGKWEQEGVNAELVMGSLRIAAGEFARANVPLRDGLFQTMDAIQAAGSESEALAIAMEVFGARAGPDMAAAILEGRFAIDDLVAAMGDADGAILTTGEATADFGEKWALLVNRATLALEPFGTFLMDLASEVIGWLGPILGTLGSWFRNISTGMSDQLAPALAAVGRFFEQVTLPAFQAIVTWLWENIPRAIQAAAGFWTDVLLPAIEGVIVWMTANVVPVIESVATWLGENVPRAIQAAAGFWSDTLQPAIQAVVEWIGGSVVPAIQSIVTWLGETLPAAGEAAGGFWNDTLLPAIQSVVEWIGGTLIPALGEVAAWLGENVPRAVQAAARFWRGTLQPALETVWGFIRDGVIPVLAQVAAWLGENVPRAVQAAAGFWSGTLLPILQTVWAFLDNHVIPIFRDVVTWLGQNIPRVVEFLAGLWENTLRPAIESVWAFLDAHVFPLLTALAEFIGSVLGLALRALAALWNDVLRPALEAVWSFIDANILPIFNAIAHVVGAVLQPVFETIGNLLGGIIDTIANVLRGIGDIINGILGIPDVPDTVGQLDKRGGDRTLSDEQWQGVRAAAGYQGGGYTGDGPVGEAAGLVHRREYVVPEGGALVLRGSEQPTIENFSVHFHGDAPATEAEAARSADLLLSALRRKGYAFG